MLHSLHSGNFFWGSASAIAEPGFCFVFEQGENIFPHPKNRGKLFPLFRQFPPKLGEKYRRRRDAEGVRPRSGPTTKWSDSKSLYVEMLMSPDADSFEIEFRGLSTLHLAMFC